MKFLHLSDLHEHGSTEDNITVDEALGFCATTYPDHIKLITGDLSDDGSVDQYNRLRESLNGQCVICPGNHDYGAAGHFYSQERADRFDSLCCDLKQHGTFAGDCLPVVTTFPGIRIIALDSNLETISPWDFACGEIGETQLAVLPSLLDTKDFTIVMLHHHPFIHSDPFMALWDAEELARVIYGKAGLVIFGHRHITGHWTDIWGIPNILAADALYASDFAREIVIEDGVATINIVPIRDKGTIMA
jgi:3',5'-cyclic AMP phosphodiesterase CpdA